jgi:hypothetical protein
MPRRPSGLSQLTDCLTRTPHLDDQVMPRRLGPQLLYFPHLPGWIEHLEIKAAVASEKIYQAGL